jgi:hypothetical protein
MHSDPQGCEVVCNAMHIHIDVKPPIATRRRRAGSSAGRSTDGPSRARQPSEIPSIGSGADAGIAQGGRQQARQQRGRYLMTHVGQKLVAPIPATPRASHRPPSNGRTTPASSWTTSRSLPVSHVVSNSYELRPQPIVAAFASVDGFGSLTDCGPTSGRPLASRRPISPELFRSARRIDGRGRCAALGLFGLGRNGQTKRCV